MRGKVAEISPDNFGETDHPRLCGEKPPVGVPDNKITGSPPPMRGKEDLCAKKLIEFRITPAYAGKRNCCLAGCRHVQDHPRLCGEKTCEVLHGTQKAGSPPPMRGKVWVNVNSWGGTGITPAYAGKRQQIQLALQAFEDHPRLCGEKLVQHFEHLFVLGSPPPMRGKVSFWSLLGVHLRITPAYAGKSATS